MTEGTPVIYVRGNAFVGVLPDGCVKQRQLADVTVFYFETESQRDTTLASWTDLGLDAFAGSAETGCSSNVSGEY